MDKNYPGDSIWYNMKKLLKIVGNILKWNGLLCETVISLSARALDQKLITDIVSTACVPLAKLRVI